MPFELFKSPFRCWIRITCHSLWRLIILLLCYTTILHLVMSPHVYFIYLFIWLFIYLFDYLFIYLIIYLFIWLFISLIIYLFVYSFIFSVIHLFIYHHMSWYPYHSHPQNFAETGQGFTTWILSTSSHMYHNYHQTISKRHSFTFLCTTFIHHDHCLKSHYNLFLPLDCSHLARMIPLPSPTHATAQLSRI